MTDFDASEEPTVLPAAGASAGAVGLIEEPPAAPPPAQSSPPQPAAAAPRERSALVRAGAAILRYLDVVVVLLAAPVAVSMGAPGLGYAIGAGAWIAQRVLADIDRGWIRRSRPPRTQLGLNLFEAFGRIWLLAGAIIVAALAGGRACGLTASIVIFAAYTVAFAIRVLSGRPTAPGPGRPTAPGREVF